MSLTLYYHPLASYCHKVLIALHENETRFDGRIINLGDDQDKAELLAAWPMGKFPVIRDHVRGRDVAESSIIIEYLDRFFAGERPLVPVEWEDALQVRLWDRISDNYLQGPMQKIVADHLRGAHGDNSHERATLDAAYGMFDRHMAARTWLTSRDFSMADCAAAPALFYTGTIQPFPDTFQHLRAYFERLMARPSVQRVIDGAKPYFAFYPFADAIPKRFR